MGADRQRWLDGPIEEIPDDVRRAAIRLIAAGEKRGLQGAHLAEWAMDVASAIGLTKLPPRTSPDTIHSRRQRAAARDALSAAPGGPPAPRNPQDALEDDPTPPRPAERHTAPTRRPDTQ